MTTVATTPAVAPVPVSRRRLIRAGSVAEAGVVNGLVFLTARAAGVDFVITDPVEGARPMPFTFAQITVVSLVFALLGVITLALLERYTRRARRNFTVLGVGMVLLSMIPIGIELANAETRVMLAVIHTLVLVALLPALRTARS